jgi:phosphatidylglycerophosphate synthase
MALIALLLNRLADGLDGELARLGNPTDAGGFLDITLDFIFYAMFPLGFALYDPANNALPAAILITSFVGTGASFLAFATQADKNGVVSPDFSYKGLFYLDGLAEGTETILVFVLMCLFPDYFVFFAYSFAVICVLTSVNRIFFGYQTLKNNS